MSEFGAFEIVGFSESGSKIMVKDRNTGVTMHLGCNGMNKPRAIAHAEQFMSFVILGSALLSRCKIGGSDDGETCGVMLSDPGSIGEGLGVDICDASMALVDCMVGALGSTAAYATSVYQDFRSGTVVDGVENRRYDDDGFGEATVIDCIEDGDRYRFTIGRNGIEEIVWSAPVGMPFEEAMEAARQAAVRWSAGGEVMELLRADIVDGAWVASTRRDGDVGIRIDGGEVEAIAKMLRMLELAAAAQSMTAVTVHAIATEGNTRLGPELMRQRGDEWYGLNDFGDEP